MLRPHTLLSLIHQQAARLTDAGVSFGHGTLSAFDEAVWLALWAMQLPIDDLDAVADAPVSALDEAAVIDIITQRITTRKPAAYLTREAWLQGVPFYVDERVIVPRSLIAEVIADGSIDAWLSDQTRRVLDLCTGNGSLAVLAAMAYPDVSVVASDLSEDALAVARINLDKHDLAARITLMQSDGLSHVPGLFDLILCNPPYVNAQSMAALPPEYLAEPNMALASGADGMDFTRALLAQAASHLTSEGVLVLEIGNEQKNFCKAFPDLPVFWLDTSAGDNHVLLITTEMLRLYQHETI
ncbi:MAG: 50S ribosomal protein L3 N(5)-glutamine methyltransferase [Cytophagales bacterium]|nr:50S ribosomal protein L3 N(5)-glutamine methyltransferase [Cytophagales bacterium]